jgi:hypothetical protein
VPVGVRERQLRGYGISLLNFITSPENARGCALDNSSRNAVKTFSATNLPFGYDVTNIEFIRANSCEVAAKRLLD